MRRSISFHSARAAVCLLLAALPGIPPTAAASSAVTPSVTSEPAAPTTPARDPGASGLIYGDGFSYRVAAPAGWILDTHSGVADGFNTVFYPEGHSWANAPAVMYVSTVTRRPGETLDGVIAEQTRSYVSQAGSSAQVKNAPALALASGASAPVRLFAGDRWGNHEAIAYIESPNVIGLVVLTSHRQSDFDIALPSFRALSASWRLVGQGGTEVFEAALAAAKSNEQTPAGKAYAGPGGGLGGGLKTLAPVMEQCTRGASESALAPFDVVARIAADGTVEDAQVEPATDVSRCLCAELRKARFAPPPEPGWWVQVHMAIAP